MNNKAITVLFYTLLCLFTSEGFTQTVYFEDSPADTITVGNNYFEIQLRKSNGSFTSIVDKSTGQKLTDGNEDETLWSAEFYNSGIGGSDFGVDPNYPFNYYWDSLNNQLTLQYQYTSEASIPVSVNMLLTLSEQTWFDLQLKLRHSLDDTVYYMHILNNLMIQPDQITEMLSPLLPGIRFNQGFFLERRSYEQIYPGGLSFADYIYFKLNSGQFALYSVLSEDVTPITNKLLHYDNNLNFYTFKYSNKVHIIADTLWNSPIVRIRIGEDYLQTIEAYRNDTGLSFLPSIRDKLGGLYDKINNALFVGFSPFSISVPEGLGFNLTKHELYRKLWQSMPGSSILFITGWPPEGHDASNPDIFPVDPSLGTDEDFRVVCESAKDAGHLIMPYINPTFWSDESETVQSLDIEEFVTLNHDGNPQYECYAGNCGYGVCPYSPTVIDISEHTMQELNSKIPTDMIFEDQVGSRGGFDFNKYMPNPTYHAQGWLEHTRRYKDLLLTAEHGHDRQVETHFSYLGNLLIYVGNRPYGDKQWGEGNWEYFPVTPIMAHDKIFFYTSYTPESKQMLNWNLAMGQIPIFSNPPSDYNNVWHKTVDAFHRHVVSCFTDERMLDYIRVNEDVTRSLFENYEVLSNWSNSRTLAFGDYTISTEGFIVTNNLNDLTAGIFTSYNGSDLAGDDHYLIETQYTDSVVIYHPQGDDTSLKLKLQSMEVDTNIRCYAFTNNLVFDVPVVIDSPYINFMMKRNYEDNEVSRYVIVSKPINLITPALLEPAHWSVIATTYPALKWQEVTGALSYQIQIASDRTFELNIVDSAIVTGTEFISDSLKAGTTYFWRVRGVGAEGTGPWSFIRRFRVEGINISDRLLAYYPLDGTPEDYFGNNDGTFIGDVSPAPDRFGNPDLACSFAGDEDYIEFTESEAYTSLNKQLTLSGWIHPRYLEQETGLLVRDMFWYLLLNTDGMALGYIFDENQNTALVSSGQNKIPLNKWTHLAYTYDGNTISIYFDGKLIRSAQFLSQSIGKQNISVAPTLGKGIAEHWNDFDGSIDEVRIYDRALNMEEMAELYRKTSTENFPPEIITFSPVPDTTITEGDYIEFFIEAQDEDNDKLFYTWFLDDSLMTIDTAGYKSSIEINFPTGTAGTHTVKCSVSDGIVTIENSWNVIVEENISGVQSENNSIPIEYSLRQNYPNPFNPTTHIRFGLPETVGVKIELYNIQGERVKILLNTRIPAGYHVLGFEGSNLASGIYFYKMKAGDFISIKKCVFIK